MDNLPSIPDNAALVNIGTGSLDQDSKNVARAILMVLQHVAASWAKDHGEKIAAELWLATMAMVGSESIHMMAKPEAVEAIRDAYFDMIREALRQGSEIRKALKDGKLPALPKPINLSGLVPEGNA